MWMISYLLIVMSVYYRRQVSFVLGFEIHQDRRKGVLGLSQKAYIEKILKKFSMHKYSPSPAPIVKGDRYGDLNALGTNMRSIK